MKAKRRAKIVELITTRDIETQEDLVVALKENGYDVTQATASRDIRALKLTKVPADNGKHKYAIIKEVDGPSVKYVRILTEGLVSMEVAQNILVVKTITGMAMGVATALDALAIREILGCIAGDDTIVCVMKSEEIAKEVKNKINILIT